MKVKNRKRQFDRKPNNQLEAQASV